MCFLIKKKSSANAMSGAHNRPNFGAISIVDTFPHSLNAHNRKSSQHRYYYFVVICF